MLAKYHIFIVLLFIFFIHRSCAKKSGKISAEMRFHSAENGGPKSDEEESKGATTPTTTTSTSLITTSLSANQEELDECLKSNQDHKQNLDKAVKYLVRF